MIGSREASKAWAEIVYGMPRDKYDRLTRVNWSRLKYMAQSPAHYRHSLTAPFEDTDAKKLGRATHGAVLEPELFNAAHIMWDLGTRSGKEWERFKAKHEGLEILTEKAFDQCMAIQHAVRSDSEASKYLAGGKSEVSILWRHVSPAIGGLDGFALDCKGRIDFEGANALVDLKITRDGSPIGFGKQAENLKMYTQAAFYLDGYRAATGRELPYVLVAAENKEPYVVQVYTVTERQLQAGREQYRSLLSRVDICTREARWPGYATGPMDLTLPIWSGVDSENDLTELDLEFHEQGEM